MPIELLKADLPLTRQIIVSLNREIDATRRATFTKIKALEAQLMTARQVEAGLIRKKYKPDADAAPAAVVITDPTGNVELQGGCIVVRATDNHTPSTEVQDVRAWVGPAADEPEFFSSGSWLTRDEQTPQNWYGFISVQGDPQTGAKLAKVWTQHLTVPDTDTQECTTVNPS